MRHLLCIAVIIGLPLSCSSLVAQEGVNYDSLRTVLEDLFMKDQTFRLIYKEAEEKLGAESDEMEYFWEVVEANDKVLEAEVTSIIEKNGWLGISQVGRRANSAQYAILQHGAEENKALYAPLFKASVLSGESQGIQYANMVDWHYINIGEQQLYGTAIDYDSAAQPSFFPIRNLEKVNGRRAEIGLGPLSEVAEGRNISFPRGHE